MNAWIANVISSSIAWVSQQPALSSTLPLVLQVAVLIALARILVAIACRNDPAAKHRIWFLTATVVLVLMPIHVLRFGWKLHVPVTEAALGDRITAASESPMFLEAETIEGNPRAEFDPPKLSLLPGQVDERKQASSFYDLSSAFANSNPLTASPVKHIARQSQLLTATVAIYFLGIVLLTTRAIYGTFVLNRLAHRATNLSTALAELLAQISKRLRLSRAPLLKSCESVSMPFLVGLRSQVVMVPAGFEAWSRPDQEAVLLHEMMHIKRNDCFGELFVRVMQIVYFFHPACWYLASKLRESRELATDRGVIELGTDAKRYANSLLSIMSQHASVSGSRMVASGLAIPMSAIEKLENRLNNILCRNMPRRNGLVRSMLLLVVLASIATTFRLDSLDAQTETTPRLSEPTSQTVDQPKHPSRVTQNAGSPSPVPQSALPTDSENDLYKMVRDCVVTPVPGEDSSLTFNFSGRVVSAAGQPVGNAIVVLREDIQQLRRRKPMELVERWQYLAKREGDILGKTTTDANGHYEFQSVRAPAIDDPEYSGHYWSGGLAIVHESAGADFTSLRIPLVKKQFTSTVNISLTPPMKITGRCTTKEGQTVEGAIVLLQLKKHIKHYDSRHFVYPHDLSIFNSQIQPRARTKSDGSFEFTGMPAGWIAEVYAYHRGQLVDGLAAIATSDDVSLKSTSVEALKLPVLHSPASLQLESFVSVQGVVVDELGKPVSGALVARSSFCYREQTDESGKFEYGESSVYSKVIEQLNKEVNVHVEPPMKSVYLGANYLLPRDEILNGKPLQLTIRKGVKVTGRVLSEEGQAIANVTVTPHGDLQPHEDKRRDYHASKAGITNSNGEYEVVLLPGTKCDLLFATDEPGYSLPSKLELDRGRANSTNSPHLSVEITDGQPVQLKPFIVSKLAPLKVSVLRSDGSPANGAMVRLREQRQHLTRVEDTIRSRPKLHTTDKLGQVTIELYGMPFDQTLIEATLVDGTQGYFGFTSYENAKKGKAKIQLKPGKLIQGSVLILGRPVADAQIGIHMRTTTFTQQGNNSVRGFATDEYDVTRTVVDGSYRIVVPNDKEYEVNVQFAGSWADKLLTAIRPLRTNSAGILTGDFNLKLGEYEISGVVVDENDKPLAHMQVAIEATPDVSPADFIGYNQSRCTTDSNGRFSLRNVPEGTYSISVRRPPMLNPSNPSQLIEQDPTRVAAKSGDRDLRVKLVR